VLLAALNIGLNNTFSLLAVWVGIRLHGVGN